MAPPFIPPGVRANTGGGFYLQAGVQFRNIEKFVIEKRPANIRWVDTLGVPPFGPNTSTYFGSATGVTGYPTSPTGNLANLPDVSGIWYYNNGGIDPNGFYIDTNGNTIAIVWPFNPFTTPPGNPPDLSGLGRYATTSGTPFDIGMFSVANPSAQVGGLNGTGFDVNNPPSFVDTYSVTWERVMNNMLYPGETAPPYVASRILVASGIEHNMSYNEQLWTPTIEVGYQWGSFFDIFYGFSWFNMKEQYSKVFPNQAYTYRRVFQDTFPFSSDNSATWPVGSWTSATVTGTANVNNQILPDTQGVIGFPRRVFSERLDQAVPPVPITEFASVRTDMAIYENKLGARSWTPIYGVGKMGFFMGPLMNIIYYRASANDLGRFDLEPGAPVGGISEFKAGWTTTFGLFLGSDLEIVSNSYFVRGSIQYSWQLQGSVNNSDTIQTVFNLGGISGLVSGGVQF